MDVLYLTKANHSEVRARLEALVSHTGPDLPWGDFEDLSRRLQIHLLLQREYVFPEVAGLFTGSQVLIDAGVANHAIIGQKLKILQKLQSSNGADPDSFFKKLAELRTAVSGHFDLIERSLMPKMRNAMRTEDREDLGQVLLDAADQVSMEQDEATRRRA